MEKQLNPDLACYYSTALANNYSVRAFISGHLKKNSSYMFKSLAICIVYCILLDILGHIHTRSKDPTTADGTAVVGEANLTRVS